MKQGCFAKTTALALALVLTSGTAQAQILDRARDVATFAADGALAYFGGKSVLLHPTSAPSSPKRPADETTSDGALIWKDKEGRIACIKLASGPVFEFKYDKNNVVHEVVEPSGSRLSRNGNGREWSRRTSDGKKTPVYGTVTFGPQHEIRYLADDGSLTVFNTNGYVVELDKYSGHNRVTRVTDSKGRTIEFGYDAESKPLSVKTADGFILVRSDGDTWYRSLPGTTRDTTVPYVVDYDSSTGEVSITTPSNTTKYGVAGVTIELK